MKSKITIEGMHCYACESKVKKKLGTIKQINSISVNAAKGYAIIEHEKNVSANMIKKVLKDTDYKYISMSEYKQDFKKIKNVILIIIFFLVFFNLTKIYTPAFDDKAKVTLSLVFSFGLLNSLHCIGMCGSLLMTYLISAKENKSKGIYNYILGRIISYTAIGALLGLFGSAITISDTFRSYMLIGGSIIMAILAFKMIGWINVPVPRIFKFKFNGSKSMFGVGLLNGFMPCGPMQIMQLFALTSGSLISGALIMLVFSLGTSISLLILGLTSSKINLFKNKNFKYIGFIVIVVMSYNMFTQGMLQYSLTNNNEKIINSQFTTDIEEGVEYREVDLAVEGRYYFSEKEVNMNMPIKINFIKNNIDGCNNPAKFISPSGEVFEVDFNESDYIIYIPDKSGKLKIVCWMNMRFSNLNIL